MCCVYYNVIDICMETHKCNLIWNVKSYNITYILCSSIVYFYHNNYRTLINFRR